MSSTSLSYHHSQSVAVGGGGGASQIRKLDHCSPRSARVRAIQYGGAEEWALAAMGYGRRTTPIGDHASPSEFTCTTRLIAQFAQGSKGYIASLPDIGNTAEVANWWNRPCLGISGTP